MEEAPLPVVITFVEPLLLIRGTCRVANTVSEDVLPKPLEWYTCGAKLAPRIIACKQFNLISEN